MQNIGLIYTINSRQLPQAKICQRYAKDIPEVVLRLQIQDNYLKQRYAKYMPGKIPWLQIQETT